MNLRIVSFAGADQWQPGVLIDDDTVAPLAPMLARHDIQVSSARELIALLPQISPLISDELAGGSFEPVPLDSVALGAPIPEPGQVIALGFNYPTHSDTDSPLPKMADPVVFMKSPTSISGPCDAVIAPRTSHALDYEIEIAVVIGKPGYRIERSQAIKHVAGYMLANDITARDVALPFGFGGSPLQAQVVRGKGYPTFCPTGPWLFTTGSDTTFETFDFELRINGELRQSGSTVDMTLGFAEVVETVSATIALRAGDIILTGTPGGCGFQFDPPRYLRPGDVIEAHSAKLGKMRLPVHDEKPIESASR
ncbi:Probable 2-hydroxyhepta-2,4-diene-1, 7-dioateisomerase [Mycobacteroides abscessus subsp. abscessus]|uniref:fumarylacetoacetate hydrolase family protein n=1 Tax=Mycobacteroides abscessus TaxID=36809 RepID=UPI00092A6AD1|nr:fumarylacetoacetate hydrolase family protein [Mycobacteroides abscessus]SHR42767.1 Probable 2-hydroxyhepta-2,4-diene-1, 7-dioateisomerase [Mycobacteroides abscessus subsp. abscessus]